MSLQKNLEFFNRFENRNLGRNQGFLPDLFQLRFLQGTGKHLNLQPNLIDFDLKNLYNEKALWRTEDMSKTHYEVSILYS